MKTVWRFPLTHESVQVIDVPQGAVFQPGLSAPSLYAIVDTDAPQLKETIVLVRTGTEIPLAKFTTLLGVKDTAQGRCAVLLLTQPDPAALAAFRSATEMPKTAIKPSSNAKENDEEEEDEEESE